MILTLCYRYTYQSLNKIILKRLILFTLLTIPVITNAQIGVDFHLSSMPFIGINYEINEKFRQEFRVGTDTFFQDISIEGIVTYDILNKPDYEFYAGIGGRAGEFVGLVIPVGFNFYPLVEKQFGFHIELAPIIGDFDILRGSLGIRYKFIKPAN